MTFNSWASAYPGVSDRTADGDLDGLNNGLEYALGGDPLVPSVLPQPQVAIQTFDLGAGPVRYLTVTFRRLFDPADVSYDVQFTGDLATWSANGTLASSTVHGDGTVTEVWRAADPVGNAKQFARLKTVFK